MARKLAAYVHVHGEGETKVYGPDDDVPADVARRITNEGAWVAEDTESKGAEAKPQRSSK